MFAVTDIILVVTDIKFGGADINLVVERYIFGVDQ